MCEDGSQSHAALTDLERADTEGNQDLQTVIREDRVDGKLYRQKRLGAADGEDLVGGQYGNHLWRLHSNHAYWLLGIEK